MPLQEARFSMLWFGASPPHSTPPCAHRAGAAALQEAKRHHLLGNWTCGPAAMATLPNLVPACLPGPMAAVANRTTRAFLHFGPHAARRDKPAATRRWLPVIVAGGLALALSLSLEPRSPSRQERPTRIQMLLLDSADGCHRRRWTSSSAPRPDWSLSCSEFYLIFSVWNKKKHAI